MKKLTATILEKDIKIRKIKYDYIIIAEGQKYGLSKETKVKKGMYSFGDEKFTKINDTEFTINK